MCSDGRRQDGGGQSGELHGPALHQPQAPSCIKKACSTSTSPHNRPLSAQNCILASTSTLNLFRFIVNLVRTASPRAYPQSQTTSEA
jgi:hypothetical protein